jgi:hypothetical protein
MRSRSISAGAVGRWALLLALGSGPAAYAQPPAAEAPGMGWPWMLALLVSGIAIGVMGARWLARNSGSGAEVAPPPTPEPLPRKKAENGPKAAPEPPTAPAAANAPKPVSIQSMSQLQGREPRPASSSKSSSKSSGKSGKSGHQSRKHSPHDTSHDWTVPHRATNMNATTPSSPDTQPLEPGQTVEWAAPTSTPPAIQELIDATETATPAAASAATEAPAATGGPVHYYAPAPDVPSIEHRKLSPNPLPQMPLLITLPHAEATTAQFSFSPQADQSRIIGNGVRELKEFFQFELPPTEQFTTIKNLTPGKLEKREDTWHVVQKAGIALS